MAARRKRAGRSKPPEARATRQLRRRPRPCKHCAASARRKSCRFSLLRLGFCPVNFLDQSLKARLVAHAVVKLIAIDPPENGIAVFISFLQPSQSFLFFTEP